MFSKQHMFHKLNRAASRSYLLKSNHSKGCFTNFFVQTNTSLSYSTRKCNNLMLFKPNNNLLNEYFIITSQCRSFCSEQSVNQYNLGLFYLTPGPKQNLGEAVRLFKLASEQGNSMAQNNLANCYYYGVGVEKNVAEANRFYKLAIW